MKSKVTIDDLTCSICGRVSKSRNGARIHFEAKHTAEGAVKQKKVAAKAAKQRQANKEKGQPSDTTIPITKRAYVRKAAQPPSNNVAYCPCCGCHIRAVEVALNFQA